ncbi:helix-turn-helix domain-containing protein [Carnimonas bestiolae]|uniref:helix-turn-helix domain-containing protein n=1 Tax=Carnimonas bestiolae TaxID=3402172 RepID=UPI003EDCA589
MSIEAMGWAIKQKFVKDPAARAVLIGLANHAYADGTDAFPSVETLVGYSGYSERTVQNKLKLLCEMGIIKKGNQSIALAKGLRPDRCPTVYDINLNYTPEDEDERGANGTRGANDDMNGVQMTTERGAGAAPETSINRPFNRPNISKGACGKKATSLPEDFEPNETAIAKAAELNIDIAEQLEQFKDWHTARGSTFKDWQAAFRTWLRNAKKFAQGSPQYRGKPRSTPGMHTGLSDFSDVQTREDGTVDF